METGEDNTRGLAQLEGYLLWNAEIAEAHRQARAFADQLPWLTTAQRAEVERVYTADRLEMARSALTRIADRARELRAEYTARYRQLRLRCVLAVALTTAGLAGVAGAVVAVAGRG